MAYSSSATFVPNGYDDYYMPPQAPELVAPEPQRMRAELPDQIAHGIANMDLNHRQSTRSTTSTAAQSPFPKLVNPPPNVPPSDDELEVTLMNAREPVLNSNDPEMQLAWAQDTLTHVGTCMDNEERIAAARPYAARPSTPAAEHQLKVDAMNIVTFLADQHHPKAEFLRGMWLEWGRYGQREDKKEAFRCYSRAADRGFARAEYRIGMLYESYNDPSKALRHYHRGVDAEDAASCYRLGMMTLRGQHGQPQDFVRGVDLIRRSAQKADENAAQGAYVYGMLLAKQLPQIDVPDSILPYDERQARVNIEKAAYLKFAKAQLKMGSAYELGSLGCEFNPALSVHYNALAAKQGEAEADMALSKWFLVGSEGVLPKNEKLAFDYAERAATSGLPTAEFAMGYFYEIGMFVTSDTKKALEWYQKASDHGNQDAKGRVDGMQRKQFLSKKDHENVAISRIKSQYGSQRGARPERFRQQAPSRLGQMTPVNEGNSQPPPRSGSAAPYPLDDKPPQLPANPRAGSVVPYPLNDGPRPSPRPGPGPVGGFFNAQPQPPRPVTTLDASSHPNSAFQVNPDLRSASSQTVPQMPHSQGGLPPRSSSTLPPHPADPRVRLGAGQRVASGPPAAQTQSQNYPPRGSPHPAQAPLRMNPPTPQPQQPAPSPQPQANFGFEAPLQDRSNQRYHAARYEQHPKRSHLPQVPPQQGQTPPLMQSANSMPNLPPSSTPSRAENRTPNSRPGTAGSNAPKPPAKDAAKPASTASESKPPGKGPSTFEEMGVAAAPKENDCVVM
ncbi:hypothetical protein MBLNU230_g1305t1 [Neophaeotheca triangularis]